MGVSAQHSKYRAPTPTKTHTKAKRTEKPLLHRVLHTANFKAQRGARSSVQDTRIIPEKDDTTREDIVADVHMEDVALSGQKAPLRIADPNAQLGMARQTKSSEAIQETALIEVDNVEIKRLCIVNDR